MKELNNKQIFSNAPDNYPKNIKRLVRQSILNLNSKIDSEEYSQYCFPALKALEGHIKFLIRDAGGKIGHEFNEFNKNHHSGRYYYDGPLRKVQNKTRIERCYNYYKSVRDTIVHFGDIFGKSDSTRMINTKEEADEIIKRCVYLIRGDLN